MALIVLTLLARPVDASATNPYTTAVLADHPASYWRLNDPPGAVAADQQGSNNGAISGTPAFQQPGPPGISDGAAMGFTGNAGITLGAKGPLVSSNQWSFETWFKIGSGQTGVCAVSSSSGPDVCDMGGVGPEDGNGVQVRQNGTLAGIFWADSCCTRYEITSPNSYADDTWHYFVLSREAGSLTMYVDGAVIARTTTAQASTYYGPSEIPTIGNGSDYDSAFPGELSEFAYYPYGLTAEQVAAHYAAAGGIVSGSSGSSCLATSTAQTLAKLDAQICQFVNDESTVVKQQGVLLNALGGFPHVTPTSILNTWTGPPVTLIPGSEADPIGPALEQLKEAAQDTRDEVAGMIVDKLGEAFPDIVQDIKALGDAAEEDFSAAMKEEEAAKAMQAVLSGATPTTLQKIARDTIEADADLIKKFENLVKALEKLKKDLELNAEAQSDPQIFIDLETYRSEVSTDITKLTSETSVISLLPQGIYDILPGLPIDGYTTGATAVANLGDSANGAFDLNSNLIGVPSGAVVKVRVASSPTVSATSATQGDTLGVSSTDLYGSGTFIEIGLGSVITTSVTTNAFTSAVHRPAHAAATSPESVAGSTPVRMAVVKASSAGAFSARVRIPAQTALGRHEIYVIGSAPNGSLRLLETGITVTAGPALTNPAQSHRRWREGNKLGRTSRRMSKPPIGTTFSFMLNEQASVSFAFTQRVAGRMVKGRCMVRSRKNRRGPACKRKLTRGTLSFTGHTGIDKVAFQGRTSGEHKLKPGNYTLVMSATNAAGHSSPKSLSFTVVK